MHGSFIRNLRLEGHKPTPIPFDTSFHFGASTRYYVLKGECTELSDAFDHVYLKVFVKFCACLLVTVIRCEFRSRSAEVAHSIKISVNLLHDKV